MSPREVRRRRKRRPPSKLLRFFGIAVLLGVGAWLYRLIPSPDPSGPRDSVSGDMKVQSGYVVSFSTVAQEYKRFNGKALNDPELRGQFERATESMTKRSYGGAALLLEEISKKAAVPAIFNNLGVIYLAQNDRAKALNAFQEALSRDIEYKPARQNMARLKDMPPETAAPVSHEIESNNTLTLANLIAPEKPVEGEITPGVDDVDWYKLTTPPAPRDLLKIEVEPKTHTLKPMIKVLDHERRMIEWVKDKDEAGQILRVTVGPASNSPLYIQVSGFADTSGPYILRVLPLKAFDAYEPNDEILSARTIAIGDAINANIMDKADMDYYAFETTKAGKVKVTVRNRSETLIPALATFHPDMRFGGFGPTLKKPGDLEYTFQVDAHKKYFIDVYAVTETTGAYTLIIQPQ